MAVLTELQTAAPKTAAAEQEQQDDEQQQQQQQQQQQHLDDGVGVVDSKVRKQNGMHIGCEHATTAKNSPFVYHLPLLPPRSVRVSYVLRQYVGSI